MTRTTTIPRHEEILAALGAAAAAAQDFPGQNFAVCVVDPGGHVLGSIRHDGATIAAGHSAESNGIVVPVGSELSVVPGMLPR